MLELEGLEIVIHFRPFLSPPILRQKHRFSPPFLLLRRLPMQLLNFLLPFLENLVQNRADRLFPLRPGPAGEAPVLGPSGPRPGGLRVLSVAAQLVRAGGWKWGLRLGGG
jgi:hypothetical protein